VINEKRLLQTAGLRGDECYDYTGHVLFAWHAPELWRRFTISLRRLLDGHLRDTGEAANSVRINYIKVTELQRRAVPHFHAVIRLDAPPVPGEPPTAPVCSITAADLAVLVQQAARAVTLTVTDPDSTGDGNGLALRFGTQTDIQPLEPTRATGTDKEVRRAHDYVRRPTRTTVRTRRTCPGTQCRTR
jgi:hypothetical protein